MSRRPALGRTIAGRTAPRRAASAVIAVAGLSAGLILVPMSSAYAASAATWSQAAAGGVSARAGTTMAYDAQTHNVLLYGGSPSTTSTGSITDGTLALTLDTVGDTWSWDGSAWTQVAQAGGPPARFMPAFGYDAAHGQVVLFGGGHLSFSFADPTAGTTVENDTWIWNGTAWTQLHPAVSPPGRIGATLAYDTATHTVVMFGGFDANSDLADTWIWNGTTWAQVHPATSPPARDSASMSTDPVTGKVVLFGGIDDGGTSLGDTWVWDGTTWSQLSPATSPPARDSATMDYDAALGRVVLFGGQDDAGTVLGDTWTFDGSGWTQLAPVALPTALVAAGGAYDGATSQFVTFGGENTAGDHVAETWLLAQGSKPVVRVSGASRIDTAAATSMSQFAAGAAHAVVLARADQFPDALAGGPLAAHVGGPLLLTDPKALSPAAKAEIQRALPAGGTVYVLGGTAAVSPAIDAALTALGYVPTRISGTNRFDTAVKIAQTMGSPTTIFEATGLNFPDALAGVPAAIANSGAILLTNGSSPAAETTVYLTAVATTARYALGGPAAAADPSATAIVGTDRFDTSAKVAARFFPTPTTVGVATGTNYPDALAAGVLLGSKAAPLLLVAPTGALPASITTYLGGVSAGVTGGLAFGGVNAVGADVVTEVSQAIG